MGHFAADPPRRSQTQTTGSSAYEIDAQDGYGVPWSGVVFEENGFRSAWQRIARESITYEAWFKTTSIPTSSSYLISTGYTENGSQVGVSVGIDSSGALFATAMYSCCAGMYATSGPSNVVDGEWHHAAAVVDGVGDTTTLYLDGMVVGADYQAGFSFDWTPVYKRLRLGQNASASVVSSGSYRGQGYKGALAEVAVYGDPLSQEDLRGNYRASGNPDPWFWDPDHPNWGLPVADETFGPNAAMRYQCPCKGTTENSIDTLTGNEHREFPGVSIPGRGPGLNFGVSYNSGRYGVAGPVGAGFSSPLTMAVEETDAGFGSGVQVRQEGGAVVPFVQDGSGGWVAPSRFSATLDALAGGGWRFVRNRSEVFEFDAVGRLVEVSDLNGYATRVVYDGPTSSQVDYMEDDAGRRLDLTYASGRVASVADPLGRTMSFTYSSGRLVSYVDIGGGTWSLAYDGTGRLNGWRQPRHAGTDKWFTLHYDAQGRADWEEDELDRRTRVLYDTPVVGSTTVEAPDGTRRVDTYVKGRREEVTAAAGTADESTVSYVYDPVTWGPIRMVDGENGTWVYGYDGAGNQDYVRDPTGRESWSEFNARGQVTATVQNVAAPGLPVVLVRNENVFDAAGNLEASTVDVGGPLQASVDYVYGDPAHQGDVTRVVDARGKPWGYSYHPTRGDLLTVTDPEGNVSTNVTNAVGWVTSTVSPLGTATGNPAGHDTVYTYNDRGQVESVSNPARDVQRFVYDASGLLVESWSDLGVGDADPEITRNVFDDAGQLTGVVELSRVGATETVVSTTGYTYTPTGQRESWTNGNNATWTYGYDDAGRLNAESDPTGNVTCYAYDDAGRLATKTSPDGGPDCDTTSRPASITYAYDSAGRPTSVDYTDPATADVSGITYDGAGRRLTAARAGGVTETWAWDRLGRLTAHGDANGRTTGYGWDPNGNLTQVTYPGQTTPVTRAFDDANRLERVTDWADRQTSFGYDENSQWTTTTFPVASTNVDVRTFDPSGRMTGVTWKRGATVLGSLAYSVDNESLLAAATATGAAAPTPASFGYDARDQLTTHGTAGLAVDPAGNLTETEDGRVQVFDPAQRLCWTSPTAAAAAGSCATPASDATSYGYDERGNRTKVTLPSGMESTFGYDAENRMTTAEVPGLAGNQQYWPLGSVARVVDTQNGTGTCGGSPCARLVADASVGVQVAGRGGVPATGVVAVTGTITVTGPGAAGRVDVNANGSASAGTVFYDAGESVSMQFVAKLDANGRISVRSTAAADVAVDVSGYHTTPTWVMGSAYWPTTPTGVVDTRSGVGTGSCDGGTCSTLAAGSTDVKVTGVGAIPATGVTAVSLAVVVDPTGPASGSLRVAPNGAASAGAVSWNADALTSTTLTAPVDTQGEVNLEVSGAVDVIVSVAGWWSTPTDPGADLGYTLNVLDGGPVRVADTVTGTGQCDGTACGRLAAGGHTIAVAGQAGVPAGAAMAVLSVHVTDPAAAGSLWVNPNGWNPADTIVFTDGTDTTVTVTAPLDPATGAVEIVNTMATDLAVDVVGVFARPVVTWTYAYDSTGLRRAKANDTGDNRQFTWTADGGLPLLLAEHRGAATSYLIYGPGGTPLYQITANGTPVYYHQDRQGSTRLVTNPNGTTQGKLAYNAYGKPVTNTIPWITEQPLLTYTGQYRDNETGYIYLRARYHDPTTAQFTTVDPILDRTGEPYSYAGGDPTNSTDPTGLWCLLHNDDGGCKGARWIEEHADTVSQVAGVVASVCGFMAVVTAETVVGGLSFGSCFVVAGGVSVGAAMLHTAVTCQDIDRYCRNSFAALVLTVATLGVGQAIGPSGAILSSADDVAALCGVARWVGALNVDFFGALGGLSIDTTERPK